MHLLMNLGLEDRKNPFVKTGQLKNEKPSVDGKDEKPSLLLALPGVSDGFQNSFLKPHPECPNGRQAHSAFTS